MDDKLEPEKLDLPQGIRDVLVMLETAELPAWLVGGCLRDLLLGRRPQDWDFATPCPPDLVREKLGQAGLPLWDTGLKHGTLTFRFRGVSYEITTFRVDGPYQDHRRPAWVAFTPSLREDLARRDFTVNALAYSLRDGLSDPFGGLTDLRDRRIRAVGRPADRIEEDALRILRGVRFAGSLDFELDDSLAQIIREKAPQLAWISRERLAAELRGILLLPRPRRALQLLAELRVWPYLIPEMAPAVGFEQQSKHHHLDVYEHLLETVDHVPPEPALRLAALLHDIAKPVVFTRDKEGKSHFYNHEYEGAAMAKAILGRLRFSHALRDQVVMLILHHMLHLKVLTEPRLRGFISRLPKPRAASLEQVLLLQRADLLASRYTEKSLADLEAFAGRCRAVLASGCPLDIGDLALRGDDLVALGVAPAERGKAMQAMLDEVLREPEQNRRPALLQIAARFLPAEEREPG